MADIIDSRNKGSKTLMLDFKQIVATVRKKYRNRFLSPITITLGDEFQAVVKSLSATVEIIFSIEEEIIKMGKDIRLKYVVEYGNVDTDINSKIAYEMLGGGLTSAREHLLESKREKDKRVNFYLRNEEAGLAIENAFFVAISIRDKWKVKDSNLMAAFMEHRNYQKVAQALSVDRSQIWRREKTLMIKEYFALKETIKYLSVE